MENTLQNKGKFIAQYWGQNIFKFRDGQMNPQKIGSTYMTKYGVTNRYLVLKPLSLITDEDAIEVAKLAYVKLDEYHLEMGRHVVNLIIKDVHLGSISCQEFLSIASYLKSKDYYIGDGAEIQYGWVKLKTEQQEK